MADHQVTDRKAEINQALDACKDGDFHAGAKVLLGSLGYSSERTLAGQTGDVSDFFDGFQLDVPVTQSEAEFRDEAESAHLIFQITNEEIAAELQQSLFTESGLDKDEERSFLFVAVELRGDQYPRGKYAQFAREVNKRPHPPTVVLFRSTSGLVTLAFPHRRPSKRNAERDVLGKVSLVREIDPTKPHRAHIDILNELALEKRVEWMERQGRSQDFEGLYSAWLDTLDTEQLNKRFYKDLFRWFERACEVALFPSSGPRVLPSQEHVIRLITRLLFVWFIKEKGLVAEDLFVAHRVGELLKDYDAEDGDSYYRAVLQNLFFATLNTEINQRGFTTGTRDSHRNFSLYRYREEMTDPDALLSLFRRTPFINGGLFDCLDSEEGVRDGGWRIDCFTDNPAQRSGLSIPNHLFFDTDDKSLGLITLFNRYKFTVEENTPIEQEVALDPELLGKVFENLLAANTPETRESARRQTGTYYTPRPVVDYMVNEALNASLAKRLQPDNGDETEAMLWRDRLAYLFDYDDAFKDASELFTDDECSAVVRAIARTKVLDPAVGSGAFPMGVLHKLTLALRRLDPDNKLWQELQKELALDRVPAAFDTRNQRERDEELQEISDTFERYRDSDFGRKLYLIQNSIFGVDIQPIATQIAKLRCFISLAIEQEPTDDAGNNFGIRPLPNLETRFVVADTLLGLERPLEPTLDDHAAATLQRELATNRERHFHATNRSDKLRYRQEDGELRSQLADALRNAHFSAEAADRIARWDPYDQNAHADWFDSEYMFGIKDGFDIVIGNPPYSRTENQHQQARQALADFYSWSGDLYEYFIVRGISLAASTGLLSYIANDSFVTFSQKRKIREAILDNQLHFLARAPAQTFDATIYAAILLLARGNPPAGHSYLSGGFSYPSFEFERYGRVPYRTVLALPDRRLLLSPDYDLLVRMMSYPKMREVCNVLDAGIHSGNVRDRLFFKHDRNGLERLLQGRQIERYSLQWDSPRAQYMYCDIEYEPRAVPGVGRGGRPSEKNEYWTLKNGGKDHRHPERLLLRQTGDDLVAAFQSEARHGRYYTDNTLFTLLPLGESVTLKYLLGLLNSCLVRYVYQLLAQEKGKTLAQVKVKTVEALPIAVAEQSRMKAVESVVDQILGAKEADPESDTSEWESEIDRLVYDLYQLTDEEIAAVEAYLAE